VTVTEAAPLPAPVLLGVQEIEVRRRPITARTRRIEKLALKCDLLDDDEIEDLLLPVVHKSLRGGALWAAWLQARDAIGNRNVTPRCDGDYGIYRERAAAAIEALIHGTRRSRQTYGGGGVA
jgi:hypothetical protein